MKYVLVAALLFLSQLSYSQMFKFKANNFMLVTKDKEGEFQDAYGWSPTTLWLVMDLDGKKITLYSQKEQDFAILSFETPTEDENGYKWDKFPCIDQDNKKCTVRLVMYNKTLQQKDGAPYLASLYLDYSDITCAYRLALE